jgi:ferredoxin--NADP+ reductase
MLAEAGVLPTGGKHGAGGGRRVAVVGSGASGCYAAEAILKGDPGARVDVIERLPTPFGLIRYGVAPDHPGTKAVARTLERTLGDTRVAYYGGITVGRHVSLQALRERYDAVVVATGVNRDRRLGVPGEDLFGVVGSGRFASWYNDHPLADDMRESLSTARDVLIVGAGNVALDVARVLAKERSAFDGSDISDPVLAALAVGRPRRIVIAARRGPEQSRFAPAELRELIRTAPGRVFIEPTSRRSFVASAAEPSSVVRELAALPDRPEAPAGLEAETIIEFRFDAVPIEFLGASLASKRIAAAVLATGGEGPPGAISIPVDLAITCIGYEYADTLGLPTDSGAVLHDEGRVDHGLYVVGWAKRGPSGTIGTNRADSYKVVARLLEDTHSRRHRCDGKTGVESLLLEAGLAWVDFDGWKQIDARETATPGHVRGRRKIRELAALLEIGARLPPPPAIEIHETVPSTPSTRGQRWNA